MVRGGIFDHSDVELMKRFYQTEWQGIQFSDFAILSEVELANAKFYNAFYSELFRRYGGYDELDVSWREYKKELADWIADQLQPGARILSVGCGLGYIESCLHREHGDQIEVHVSDYASGALNWLRQELPEERIHLAGAGAAHGNKYDLIYLSGVAYAVPTDDLVNLLEDQRTLLSHEGACLIIENSCYEDDVLVSKLGCRTKVKETAKALLSVFGLYQRGQFWGWQRTRAEFRYLMQVAGYSQVEDGFIEISNQRTYFIKGQC